MYTHPTLKNLTNKKFGAPPEKQNPVSLQYQITRASFVEVNFFKFVHLLHKSKEIGLLSIKYCFKYHKVCLCHLETSSKVCFKFDFLLYTTLIMQLHF